MQTVKKAKKWLQTIPEGRERQRVGANLAKEFKKILGTTDRIVGNGSVCGVCGKDDEHDYDCPVTQLKPLREFIREWEDE